MPDDTARDSQYLSILSGAIHTCAQYRPMFGQGRKGGLSLDQFQALYRRDPLYNWIGFDSPLMYAAHKAAGGMTSVYRQLGMGCQWIVAQVLRHHLGLTDEEAEWSYMATKDGKPHKMTLDGRIDLAHVREKAARARVAAWLEAARVRVGVTPEMGGKLTGAIFEVRQGYKSKDSKRQVADIGNAVNAYLHFYLPVVFVLSTQIDGDVADRYRTEKWLILTGTVTGPATESAFTFLREVVGYDLAAFFERNSKQIKAEVAEVLKALLTA